MLFVDALYGMEFVVEQPVIKIEDTKAIARNIIFLNMGAFNNWVELKGQEFVWLAFNLQ